MTMTMTTVPQPLLARKPRKKSWALTMKATPLQRRRIGAIAVFAAAMAVRSFRGSPTSHRDLFLDDSPAEDAQFHRFLLSLDASYAGEDDYDAAAAVASEARTSPARPARPALPPYRLNDTLADSRLWDYTFVLVAYDPPADAFVGLYNKDHQWRNGNKKLWKSLTQVVYALRRLFPERFRPDAPEFVFAVGSGDYPHVRRHALPLGRRHAGAPVLMFGSAFRDPDMYPNMIAMPMPASQHLDCFVSWVEREKVCPEWRGKSSGGKLLFPEDTNGGIGLQWDDLIVSDVRSRDHSPSCEFALSCASLLTLPKPRSRKSCGEAPTSATSPPSRTIPPASSLPTRARSSAEGKKTDAPARSRPSANSTTRCSPGGRRPSSRRRPSRRRRARTGSPGPT